MWMRLWLRPSWLCNHETASALARRALAHALRLRKGVPPQSWRAHLPGDEAFEQLEPTQSTERCRRLPELTVPGQGGWRDRCPVALHTGSPLPISPLLPVLPDARWLPRRPLLRPQQCGHHPTGTLRLQDPPVHPPEDMQQPGCPQLTWQRLAAVGTEALHGPVSVKMVCRAGTTASPLPVSAWGKQPDSGSLKSIMLRVPAREDEVKPGYQPGVISSSSPVPRTSGVLEMLAGWQNPSRCQNSSGELKMLDKYNGNSHPQWGSKRSSVWPGAVQPASRGAGTQTQDCGGPEPTVPVLWGGPPRGPSTRGPWEGLSIWGAQGPSPSLRQVPELLCHQSKPHGCDPGPLGSSAAGRRGPQQPGECLGGDGQE